MTTNCPRPRAHILVCLPPLSLLSAFGHFCLASPRFAVYLSLPGLMRCPPLPPSIRLFHLPSATCHSCHSCHLPLATRLLCAVLAHVYSILSLPVPLDLRGMLTAICMESSSCLAWLDASTPLLPSSARAKAKCYSGLFTSLVSPPSPSRCCVF